MNECLADMPQTVSDEEAGSRCPTDISFLNIINSLCEHQNSLEKIIAKISEMKDEEHRPATTRLERYLPVEEFDAFVSSGNRFCDDLIEARSLMTKTPSQFPPEAEKLLDTKPPVFGEAHRDSHIARIQPPEIALERWNDETTAHMMYRIMLHEIINFATMVGMHVSFIQRKAMHFREDDKTVVGFPSESLNVLRTAVGDVGSLLDKAQQHITSGSTQYALSPVDLNSVVKSLLSVMQYEFKSEGITAQVKYHPTPLRFYGDELRTKQVVRNILLNKFRALGKLAGTEVRLLSAETGLLDDGSLYARFLDNGPCITKDLDKIFDLHYSQEKGGHGIGLWVSRRIIEEKFGGKISARNIEPRGVEFLITLPAYDI